MPVVPMFGGEQSQQVVPQMPQMPGENFALMAAAQMHDEGRLIKGPKRKRTDDK